MIAFDRGVASFETLPSSCARTNRGHAVVDAEQLSMLASASLWRSSRERPSIPASQSIVQLGPSNRRRVRRRRRVGCRSQAVQESSAKQKLDQSLSSRGNERFKVSVKDLSAFTERWQSSDESESLGAGDVATALASSAEKGLADSPEQLEERQQTFGSNQLPGRKEVSLLELVFAALDDFTVIILIVSGVFSLALDLTLSKGSNDWIEGAAILAAVVVVVLVTAGNDFQKEKQFRELSALSEDVKVSCIREGRRQEISAFSLLVGDVLEFGYGDILPVDGVMISGNDIRVDESALTGESEDVIKDPQSAPFMQSGSRVLQGQGRLLVTAVGLNSQQGQIFGSLSSPSSSLREETALEKKLDRLASQIGQFGLGAGLFALAAMSGQFTYQHFIVGGEPWQWDFLSVYLHFVITSITILVVAVPEGLPLAVTVALAYSVKRMLGDNNLVRRLSAAETMGCATTICTDKTGTLTQNDMTVTKAWVAGRLIENIGSFDSSTSSNGATQHSLAAELDSGVISQLNNAIVLNCSASIQRQEESGELLKAGNRTECALLEFAVKLEADLDSIDDEAERIQIVPFSSERKRMTTVCKQKSATGEGKSGCIVYTKGAAEIMLDLCDKTCRKDGSVSPLQESDRKQILAHFGRDGTRMILVASRELPSDQQPGEENSRMGPKDLEQQLTLLAVVGISDPLRPEVPPAIEQCNRAGITVRMLTGDNALTAASIAQQSGILEQEVQHSVPADESGPSSSHSASTNSRNGWPEGSVLEGPAFRQQVLDDTGGIIQEEFNRVWTPLRVLARCSPTDKLTIVTGLQSNPEEVVCVTGDGTNDAPALKAADVGFAMNNGTSIAKEAADILLLDSNMLSIVKSVLWGRNVYAGITKFLQFQLVVNIVAVVTACTGAIVAQDSPLKAVQMLWVNLIMDSLASLALATEQPAEELLDLPPFSPGASLLSPVVLKGIVGQCVFQLTVMYFLVFRTSLLFQIPMDGDSNLQSSLIFNTFVLMQLVNQGFEAFALKLANCAQVNARHINDESNVLKGFFSNRLFLGILGGELLIQVAIVQYGGEAFSTAPLTLQQWGACTGIAALGLLVRGLLLFIPPGPTMRRKQQ